MPQIKIIYKNIKDIKPYKNNPRKNQAAIDPVAASIKEFGFKVPIVIDANNEIITGHVRKMAAEKLGIEKVPCILADDLSEEQIKAFRIADNKVAEHSTWDDYLLSIELQELADMDFDISLTDFDEEEFINSIEPHDIEDLLQELDMKNAIEKPIWVSIRTDAENQEKLEAGLKIIEKNGLRVERNYEI